MKMRQIRCETDHCVTSKNWQGGAKKVVGKLFTIYLRLKGGVLYCLSLKELSNCKKEVLLANLHFHHHHFLLFWKKLSLKICILSRFLHFRKVGPNSFTSEQSWFDHFADVLVKKYSSSIYFIYFKLIWFYWKFLSILNVTEIEELLTVSDSYWRYLKVSESNWK